MPNNWDSLFIYNCLDCVRTRECGEVETKNLAEMGLVEVDGFQQKMFWPVLEAMKKGVRVDEAARAEFAMTLQDEMVKREEFFQTILGHPLNPRSSSQMCKLFYEDLKQPMNLSRATKGAPAHLTCNDEALGKIALREPILRPLLRAIAEYRSLGVFLSTFVSAPLDIDRRMRTSYNICGTETFRLSSSENAFGSGMNMQNIPKGGEDDDSDLVLPNIRKIFIPDPGFTFFDTDLSKADLRIVAWEAEENEMKSMLKEGRDPYVETAREFYHDPTITKLKEDGTENHKYRMFKSFSHGSHYLGTPIGLSRRLGLTVHESEKTQKWYFDRYPAIRKWQQKVIEQVKGKHYVENIFGYRRYYFDRIDDDLFRQAVAWIGQSTTAVLINRIWMNIWENYPHIWVLMQVHDSLAGEFPTHKKARCLEELNKATQVILPYTDPLIIPVGIKTSEKSWGECI